MIDWVIWLISVVAVFLAAAYGRIQKAEREEAEERRAIAEDKARRLKLELQQERGVHKAVTEALQRGQKTLQKELDASRRGDRSHFERGYPEQHPDSLSDDST